MGRMFASMFDWVAFHEVAVVGVQSFHDLHGYGSEDAYCGCDDGSTVE